MGATWQYKLVCGACRGGVREEARAMQAIPEDFGRGAGLYTDATGDLLKTCKWVSGISFTLKKKKSEKLLFKKKKITV